MNELWRELEPHLEGVERIYFAGGEPLIMEEHYRILEKFIELGRDDVVISYNTNFSELRFKQYDLLALWRKFKSVGVAASLDAMGPRAEYIRKGTTWRKIEANRLRLMKEAPHVGFSINCTLSLFNAFHMPDFHRDWVERGLVGVDDWNINTLFFQEPQRIQVLPGAFKDRLTAKYEEFISGFLVPRGAGEHTLRAYAGVARFAGEKDLSGLLPSFFELNDRLDEIRGERFENVFPEYEGLRNHV